MSQNNKPKESNKIHIANLAACLRMFKPSLVNEKRNGAFEANDGVDPESLPNRDQILNTAAGAIQGMYEFVTEFEAMKARYDLIALPHAELKADAMIAHQASIRNGLNCNSLSEAMETWIGRFKQSIDVFKSIYEDENNSTAEVYKQTARNFAKRFINPQFLKELSSPESNNQPKTELPESGGQ